jgi:hypothetical protein
MNIVNPRQTIPAGIKWYRNEENFKRPETNSIMRMIPKKMDNSNLNIMMAAPDNHMKTP